MEEKKSTKKELVKKLLKEGMEIEDEDELIELLIDNPIAVNIDEYIDKNIKFGDKIADKVAEVAGSWPFIITFTLFLIGWIVLNAVILNNKAIDPYPFILLNLVLSCIAALQAPIIMMSQNRQAKKDSLRNHNDYRVDLKSELILEELHDKMDAILRQQREIKKMLTDNDVNKEGNSNEKI